MKTLGTVVASFLVLTLLGSVALGRGSGYLTFFSDPI
jgi:hypothetical protein